MPSQDEMKTVDPGKITQQGNSSGVDYSMIGIEEEKKVVVEEKNVGTAEPVLEFAEEMPSFPGGEEELSAFMGENVKYPEIARKAGVEGKVWVQFTVGKDGRVSSIIVLKGVGAGLDEEAVRVIKLMPKWTSGKQNGVPVSVSYKMPIVFRLQGGN